MIISKSDMTRILVHGMPMREVITEDLLEAYSETIENIDRSVFACFRDKLQENSLRVVIHNREVFNLLFKDKTCHFRTQLSLSDIIQFKEEVYSLILRMVAFENARAVTDSKANKYDIKPNTKASLNALRKYLKPYTSFNKKYKRSK